MRLTRIEYREKTYVAAEADGQFRIVPRAGLDPLEIICDGGWPALDRAATELVDAGDARRLAPIPRPGKIVCVGLNYYDHTLEQDIVEARSPVLFAKWPNAVNAPDGDVPIYTGVTELDYEAELGVVIGRRARSVNAGDAFDYVAGYLAVNDYSARDLQRADGQWTRAKSFDGYAPMGPSLVSADEVGDPGGLRIETLVNDEIRQSASTAEMIFGIRELIEFCSTGITLEPGDVICTGTPAGVGAFLDPPRLLNVGDVVTVRIERIGELRNQIVDGDRTP